MFYTIYKTTNLINGKEYVGKHETKDLNDGYMGSGKNLNRAIKKYGVENFSKEILFKLASREEMNAKEAELVTEEYCLREDTYNICPGGHGGFGYINQIGLNGKNGGRFDSERAKKAGKTGSINQRLLYSGAEISKKAMRTRIENGNILTFKGKKHKEETLEKLRKPKNIGSSNAQYGTMWITNGSENKKVKKENVIPEGWYKGRKL